MVKDKKGRALYDNGNWNGSYIRVKNIEYVVAPVNKYDYRNTKHYIIVRTKEDMRCGRKFYYMSEKHSDMIFQNKEEAWDFIDNEILTGNFDYLKEIENYNNREKEKQQQKENEYHLKQVELAEMFKKKLNDLKVDCNTFEELVKEYNNIDYKHRVENLGLILPKDEVWY